MAIHFDHRPQTALRITIGSVLIVLAIGLGVAYLLLNRAVVAHTRCQLFEQRTVGQQAATRALATLLDSQVRHGNDVVEAFERLAPAAVPGSAADLGIALLDAEGASMARFGSAEVHLRGGLSMLKVRDPLSGGSVSLREYLSSYHPPCGELYSAAGLDLGQTIAASRLAAGGLTVAVQQSTRQIDEALRTVRLYLLLSFMALALLLLLAVLWVYIVVANTFSAAVHAAGALRTATGAFQESLGVLRGPLHNIQGLADMLSVTENEDEHQRYLDDIKSEVRRIIGLFKQVEL